MIKFSLLLKNSQQQQNHPKISQIFQIFIFLMILVRYGHISINIILSKFKFITKSQNPKQVSFSVLLQLLMFIHGIVSLLESKKRVLEIVHVHGFLVLIMIWSVVTGSLKSLYLPIISLKHLVLFNLKNSINSFFFFISSNRKLQRSIYVFSSSTPLSASSIGFVAGEFTERVEKDSLVVVGAIDHAHQYMLSYSIISTSSFIHSSYCCWKSNSLPWLSLFFWIH